jgi:hypothetical protein
MDGERTFAECLYFGASLLIVKFDEDYIIPLTIDGSPYCC